MEITGNISQQLGIIPELPGVYKYYNQEDTIIYVGKAKNLRRRISSYFQKEHDNYKTRQLVSNIHKLEYLIVGNEQEAFLLENNLIKQHQPHYNILLKDGKSYPSICITNEEYPRIIKTRKIIRGAGQYFGPYSFGNTLDLVLEVIHKLYPIRTCNTLLTTGGIDSKKYKVCLKYHLGNCCGVCEGIQKEEYRGYIESAKKIIQGDAEVIRGQLEKEMIGYAERFEYEKAQEQKTKLDLIDNFCSKTIITNSTAGDADVVGYLEQEDNVYISMLHVHNGSITQGKVIEYRRKLSETKEEMLGYGIMELRNQLSSTTRDVVVPFIPDITDENLHFHIPLAGDKKKIQELAQKNVEQYRIDRIKQIDKLNPDQRATRIMLELQKMLGLDHLPIWIDSFDNSNIQGSDAVAGCVVFRKTKPSKSEYKKFVVKTIDGIDDYGSMREVVRRRYARLIEEGQELPDLIIADGGVGQMHAIEEVIQNMLKLNIPVAGLKKDDKHRTQTLVYQNMEFTMPITSEVFRLMVQIQDEVHRFAITYHKKKRSKSQISSQLDDIQGVGEETKRKILLHFGSLKRAKLASESEWQKLLGTKRGSTIYGKIQAQISR